jgi:cytochrome c-type biogenesis protein CcmH/NrfG
MDELVCPSCGDVSTLDQRMATGNPDLCPICGSEMLPSADTQPETASAELPAQAIAPEAIVSESANQTSGPIRTEDLLLQRLLTTPKVPAQLSTPALILILLAIFAIGVGVYFTTRLPDKFAATQPTADNAQAPDSTELFQHRTLAQPRLDSLKRALETNPSDSDAMIELANVNFDLQYWPEAYHAFEAYLKLHPKDQDARVDYATTVDKVENNTQAAINQIEKVLEENPNHIRALFNAGILSLKSTGDKNHAEELSKAKDYFERARHAAETQDTSVIPTIDKILSEIESVHPPAMGN